MISSDYIVSFAESEDIESWMKMVNEIQDNFPGLETEKALEAYKATVLKNMRKKTALCVKKDQEVVGLLLFSYDAQCLSCMAVHPKHRRNGIAYAMVEKMIDLFPDHLDIWVTTFREDDILGKAPRALYKKFGFEARELIVEFGYPSQKFVLQRKA